MTSLGELAGGFSGRFLTEAEEIAPFLTDWRGLWRGRARAVVQPDTPQDVAAVVRWCVQNAVPIVPQGGNTGLSGGATPNDAGTAIVLSLARLNKVRALDLVNNTITLDAGCILQSVQEVADAAGRYFPLSLAAEGSCTIGGNLACNAGGTAVLRYGTTRELCLGLEVVTAEGELWDGLRGLRKDNTGYDLRDIFIGSEGTLGIITGAVMKLSPKPVARVTAFVAVDSIDDALALLEMARARINDRLTAFEFLSHDCLKLVIAHVHELRSPLETVTPWYVLMEISDFVSEVRAVGELEELLGTAMETEVVLDAVVAQSITQSKVFWYLREGISQAQGSEGRTIKHDIALPISRIAEFIDAAGVAITARWPEIRFFTFGHLGDGNLHYNFSPPAGCDAGAFTVLQAGINRLTHDLVMTYGGSISAEHGLGVLRRDEAARYKSSVELRLMRAIKTALDPKGLMNPGKVLP